VRFKTTSYLENIFAFTWARDQGFFDALFTNERGQISEGCISNIFFFEAGHIWTPPTHAGLLPGVTRKQIIEVARAVGLHRFDGAFVTNSVIETLPVCAVGDIVYAIPEMIETLRAGYQERLEAAFFRSGPKLQGSSKNGSSWS
jgi:branched-subunit amino acid aminotransferase/4-amino-4-deoxychorismate lyase